MRVFITGASSGIGRALALRYGRQGACLGLTGRREAHLQSVYTELGGAPGAVYAVDVRDGPGMQRAAADFINRFGLPDIVIANAGISLGTRAGEADDESAFQAVIDTNLHGLAKTFRPFVAPLAAARRGLLVGIASMAGIRGLPGAGAYSASKAAAINYLESLRVELAGSGVRVITVLPGFVDTPMTRVNPYRMPFIIDAEDAARRIAGIIARAPRSAVVPWPMALVARALRWMPDALYDALARHAPRKPRQRAE